MPSIRIEDYLKRGVTHRALPDPTVPIVGPKGDQGASGRDGMNGRDGKDGRAGRDGRDGKDGRGLNWRGNWTEEQQYYVDDVVNYLGSSYVATQDNKLDYPNRVNNAWDLMAASGAGGARGPSGEAASLKWIDYTTNWSQEPTLTTTNPQGEIYTYTYNNGTLYRLVPTDGVSVDSFYSTLVGNVLSDLVTTRGMDI